jgi:purine-binding chemotaxis protein CheW
MSSAAPSIDGARGDELLNLVGFRIEDWRFAVRLEQVQTSVMPCPVTRVFHVPDYVLGIISLRGTIVGVLDLGRLLGLSARRGAAKRFVVVKSGGVQAAIPAQEVFRIPTISAAAINPLPQSVTAAQKQYLEGIFNTAAIEDWPASEERSDTITLIDAGQIFESQALRTLRGKP